MSLRFNRHSWAVTQTPRWRRLRWKILERDNYQCQGCGLLSSRLDVDHIKPVRTHPELGFDPDNLQALCPSCHTRKTRDEIGLKPIHPKRQEWRDLLREMQRKPIEQKG